MMKVTKHSLSKICIQLYLFDFLNSNTSFSIMKKVNCNQCAETTENFIAECPRCGAQFQYLSPDQRFYRILGLFSVIAFGAVLTLDDQVGASAVNTAAQQVTNQSE